MAKTQPACAEVRGKDERRQTKPLPRANAQRQKPASGKPLHIDCVSGTPENWRVRRGSANARLGHAYPWYATYSSHIPASLRTFPQRKPPRRQRRPGADGARRSKGTPDTQPDKTTPGRWGKPGAETAYREKGPETRPMRTAPGRWDPGRIPPHIGGRERPTHGDRQSAPWREEDAQGALAFRIGYLSFGASFTSCPRLATTGMVMALAGQASTQALQRVQSASVRSP